MNTATIERGIPWTVQQNIAQAFLLMKRSSEEMVLLKATCAVVLGQKAEIHTKSDQSGA